MDLGSIAQWAGFAVTAIFAAIGAARATFMWHDKKLVEIHERINRLDQQILARVDGSRSEVLAKVSRSEAVAQRASAELAEFKLKVASDYLPKAEFERALDRQFNTLFLRLDKIEDYFHSRIKP